MKLTFKTLQQKSFSIEAEEGETISQLKSKIQALEGFEVSAQKLILKGKILTDDALVGSIGATEKDFIVVMVTKPKAAPSQPTPVAATPSSAQTQVAPSSATTAAPSSAAATPAAPSPAAPLPDAFTASTLATGNAYEMAVNNLVEMGFPRTEVVAAMRAAFNNPDRAADYLMNGIPDSAREAAAPAQPQTAPAGVTASPATAPAPAATPAAQGQYVNLFQQAAQLQSGGGNAASVPAAGAPRAGGSAADLEFLRNSPQFQNLRQMVQAQPQLLPAMLQQIGQTNPQLLQMISQNQDQFLQMLTEGTDLSAAGMDAGGEGGNPAEYISISPEENEAVNRLAALGFDHNLALEAYLACDKNEELAANYLFDAMGGDL